MTKQILTQSDAACGESTSTSEEGTLPKRTPAKKNKPSSSRRPQKTEQEVLTHLDHVEEPLVGLRTAAQAASPTAELAGQGDGDASMATERTDQSGEMKGEEEGQEDALFPESDPVPPPWRQRNSPLELGGGTLTSSREPHTRRPRPYREHRATQAVAPEDEPTQWQEYAFHAQPALLEPPLPPRSAPSTQWLSAPMFWGGSLALLLLGLWLWGLVLPVFAAWFLLIVLVAAGSLLASLCTVYKAQTFPLALAILTTLVAGACAVGLLRLFGAL